jgi:hypothetical protein
MRHLDEMEMTASIFTMSLFNNQEQMIAKSVFAAIYIISWHRINIRPECIRIKHIPYGAVHINRKETALLEQHGPFCTQIHPLIQSLLNSTSFRYYKINLDLMRCVGEYPRCVLATRLLEEPDFIPPSLLEAHLSKLIDCTSFRVPKIQIFVCQKKKIGIIMLHHYSPFYTYVTNSGKSSHSGIQ